MTDFENYIMSLDRFKNRNPIFVFQLAENGDYDNRDVYDLYHAWQASASRQGYKLVPENPTKEMYLAGTHELTQIDFRDLHDNDSIQVYKAMIGAVE